ncbi:MAG: hypothetical protein HWE22_03520 [Flavobacteriales bacterium]|nr:hypothetical protein [Flavobacteriales bacterium]
MQTDFFSIFQLIPAFLWLIIILVVAQVRKGNYAGNEGKYYMYNVYAKLFFSLSFALFFILVYGGGDTIAYYHGTVALNNLFMEDPGLYFEQLFSTPTDHSISLFFNSRTGYPPGWIYREPEGFFVCKLTSILSFFTFKSFIATTLLLSYFVASATWKLFAYIRSMNIVSETYLAIGVLFLPSVNFWCTGISKDTLVYIGVVTMVYNGLILISRDSKNRFRAFIFFILMALMVYHIRSVVLYVTILSLALAYSTAIAKRISNSNQATLFVRFAILIGGFVVLSQALSSGSEAEFLEQNEIFQEAAITQRDFATNVTYGDNRYSIGEIQYTPLGLLRASPFAITAGIFRPFIWEALSPSLIFNGLESLLFLYLLFIFIRKDALKKIKLIQNNELLLFSISFVLILAFVTGLTSGLFGVLVRLRAPLLPFFIILLSLTVKNEAADSKQEITQALS